MSSQQLQSSTVNVDRVQAEFNDIQRALSAVGPLMEEVKNLHQRVGALESDGPSEQLLNDLQNDLRELEEGLEEIDSITDDRMQAVEERQNEIEGRIEALESLFAPRALGKERAHKEAQKRDVEDVLDIGETRTVVVEDTLYDRHDPQLKTTIEGVVTFVDVEDRDTEEGDTIDVKVYDLRDTTAHAKRVEDLE